MRNRGLPFVRLAVLALTSFASPTVADEYEMSLRLDPKAGTLGGSLRLNYSNDSGGPLAQIRLRLDLNLDRAESMVIQSVKDAGGEDLAWKLLPFSWGKHASEQGQVSIALPEPLSAGESRCVIQGLGCDDAPGRRVAGALAGGRLRSWRGSSC